MPLPARNNYYLLLYPFSLLYGLIIWIRNFLFDYKMIQSVEFPIPIISVGNITVGGTGKTPHIEYLVELLRDEFQVATLSRGYKRKTRNFILADKESGVMDIGDEPVQIKHKYPDINVAVDRRRVNGVRELMARIPDLDVILLDDAFQHRHIKPGLSVLLIDFNRPLSEDHLLPAGRLREQGYERRRANIILITKCPDRLKPIERRIIIKDLKLYPFQHLFFSKLNYGEPVPLFDDTKNPVSLADMKASKPQILMVTGIAGPRLYKKHLRSISTNITELTFPDHHEFNEKDLASMLESYEKMEGDERFIFTTAKDATRLRKFTNIAAPVRERMFYVPVGIEILNEDGETFDNNIRNYVRDNKRDNILHKQQDKDQA
ncbi:MAG TPA: tetraacyldisaccharide 4'-kinase [Bacteroides sp.]|nr:tetraacyldisaccharide 4'-kinase [Bacteroides sp.]